MKHLDLRTSLFSFDPGELADAYRVQVGEHYLAAWQVLQNLERKTHFGLPTHALEEMLAVMSKGPVKVNSSPYKDRGESAVLLLNPLPVETINQVLQLWALEVMSIWAEQIEGLETKLAVVDVLPVVAYDITQPGRISSLAYPLVPWLVGKAMASKPMQTTKGSDSDVKLITLQQASEGSLLAWGDPIVREKGARHASALHVIEPHLVLLRDCEEPFIQLRVKLSRIMPNWVGSKRFAWIHTGDLIVKANVRSRPTDDGWKNSYSFPTQRLLAFMGQDVLPELKEGEIPFDSTYRPVYSIAPLAPLIGSGPGPLFLDQASFHLVSTLKGCKPLLARKASPGLSIARSVSATEPVSIRAAVLAAHSDVMLRLLTAAQTLSEALPFFKKIAPPKITLERLDVSDARRMLEGKANIRELSQWLKDQVIPEIGRHGLTVAIVETSTEAASLSREHDPKHYIRRVLAEHGIVTQFIMHAPPIAEDVARPSRKEARDFKALNTVTEALRLNGYFPTSFTKTKKLPADTTVLSIGLDRISDKGQSIYLPVITRTLVGSQKAEIFWFTSSPTSSGRWFEFTEGVAAIHGTSALLSPDLMSKLITQSLLTPCLTADSPLIVCLSSKLRGFYRGLQDTPAPGLPSVPAGAAVVRIRVDDDIAQMTGNHSVSPDQPQYIAQKLGLFQSCRSPRVYYFVSPSKIYSKAESQRHHSRYQVEGSDLKDSWQQLGVTEITIIQPGAFTDATVVAEQVAVLCRNAPLWDGELRLPSLMHLGMQIAGDHPIMEMSRKSDANRQAQALKA